MKNTISPTLAVINFVYFLTNFPSPFESIISDVWKDDPRLASHLKEKFSDCYQKNVTSGFITSAVIVDFFFQLSHSNQAKFAIWIDTNYHCSSEHREQFNNDNPY